MTPGSISAGLATALVLAGAWAHESQQVFRGRVDVVSVNVAVTRGRNPVVDLRAEDFELLDNGVVQRPSALSLQQVPIDVTAVVSGALASRAGIEREILQGYEDADRVAALMRPGDTFRLLRVNMDGVREIRAPGQPVRRVVPTPGLAVFDSIFYAMTRPVPADRRHLVVTFTDGFDDWSIIEPERLPDLVDRSDAVLHAVLYEWPPNEPRPGRSSGRFNADGSHTVLAAGLPEGALRVWRASHGELVEAVRRSGGLHHSVSQGVDPLEEVLDAFRTSYVLQYTPTDVDVDGWHEIDVEITRSGRFDVRARRGYYGG